MSLVDLEKKSKQQNKESGTAGALSGGAVAALVGKFDPLFTAGGAYSGYRGAKDKAEGKNRMGTHMLGWGATLGGLSGMGAYGLGMSPGRALKSAVISGLIGSGIGAATYGAGRATVDAPKKK